MYKERQTNEAKEKNFLLTLLKHVDTFFLSVTLPSTRRRQIPKIVLVVLVVVVVTDRKTIRWIV